MIEAERRPLLALFVLAIAAHLSACSAQPCGGGSISQTPQPSIECAAGQLCYQGSCIRSCSAGSERGERCDDDSVCPGARPNCVDGFCSACEGGQVCVPTLDICRPFAEAEYPETPNVPMPTTRPPYPVLDGGWVDGGLKRVRDAGVEGELPPIEITHVGYLDLARIHDYRTGNPTQSASIAFRAFDVRGNGLDRQWRAELEPPAIQSKEPLYEFGQCVIRGLTAVTSSSAPSAVSLGEVRVDSHPEFPNSIRQQYVGMFNANVPGYQFTPAGQLPQDFITYSTLGPTSPRYITLTSMGAAGITARSWPNPDPSQFLGHHVPFELLPNEPSLSLLRSTFVVEPTPIMDLSVRWQRIGAGRDTFERVVVRVTGRDYELFCDEPEGPNGRDDLVIPVVTLDEFRMAEGTGVYPLYFERVSTERLPIEPEPGAVVDVTVRVRHTLVGSIDFR